MIRAFSDSFETEHFFFSLPFSSFFSPNVYIVPLIPRACCWPKTSEIERGEVGRRSESSRVKQRATPLRTWRSWRKFLDKDLLSWQRELLMQPQTRNKSPNSHFTSEVLAQHWRWRLLLVHAECCMLPSWFVLSYVSVCPMLKVKWGSRKLLPDRWARTSSTVMWVGFFFPALAFVWLF